MALTLRGYYRGKHADSFEKSGCIGTMSIEAFCLRMLHKKYFNVSNRWYAPDLHVSKMAIVATNFSVMKVVFFFFPFVT